jgi:hypothetical protein
MQGKYNLCWWCWNFCVWDTGWWDRETLQNPEPRWYCNDCWHRWLSPTEMLCRGCYRNNMAVSKKNEKALKGYCIPCWERFGMLPDVAYEPCQCPECRSMLDM